jgi:DNA modification methylase
MIHIIKGGSLDILKQLSSNSIDCCITSPPYWQLRDYKDPNQIGREKDPNEYIDKLVTVFHEVKRVLKKTGTLWLNIGDTYAGGNKATGRPWRESLKSGKAPESSKLQSGNVGSIMVTEKTPVPKGMKRKDLVGIPWMLAFALRADGWWLRQDIIWDKKCPMPESVKDRCTRSHEYIFLLSKAVTYWSNFKAIAEPTVTKPHKAGNKFHDDKIAGPNDRGGHSQWEKSMDKVWGSSGLKNKRSVWRVAPATYKGAHFATYSPKLIEPIILAGCPENGIILDPFSGSGTTAVAAYKLNRSCISIDIKQEYCQMAYDRVMSEIGLYVTNPEDQILMTVGIQPFLYGLGKSDL